MPGRTPFSPKVVTSVPVLASIAARPGRRRRVDPRARPAGAGPVGRSAERRAGARRRPPRPPPRPPRPRPAGAPARPAAARRIAGRRPGAAAASGGTAAAGPRSRRRVLPDLLAGDRVDGIDAVRRAEIHDAVDDHRRAGEAPRARVERPRALQVRHVRVLIWVSVEKRVPP